MSRYRKLAFTLLSLVVAVFVLERCGSNQTVARSNQELGQKDVCNDGTEIQLGQNRCEENGNDDCNSGEGDDDRCVSFCRDIQPIFDNRCTRCHNPELLRGGLDLTAGNSYRNLVNQPTSAGCMAEVPGSIRVVPCFPSASMLWLKARPDPARCRAPMPMGTQGLGVIAPREFARIERWIAQGAQNN